MSHHCRNCGKLNLIKQYFDVNVARQLSTAIRSAKRNIGLSTKFCVMQLRSFPVAILPTLGPRIQDIS